MYPRKIWFCVMFLNTILFYFFSGKIVRVREHRCITYIGQELHHLYKTMFIFSLPSEVGTSLVKKLPKLHYREDESILKRLQCNFIFCEIVVCLYMYIFYLLFFNKKKTTNCFSSNYLYEIFKYCSKSVTLKVRIISEFFLLICLGRL